MNSFRVPKGTQDILPGEVERWQYLEEKARDLCRRFGYQEIRTPIFEQTELFARGVGETTDIVTKEMYTFEDKGGRNMTLRPEGTAGVARSFVQHKMHGYADQPQKLFYIGPMFRYEQPQAGRWRQLHQFGVEAIGSDDPAIDAEVISIAYHFYREIGLDGLSVDLNSIGCPVCRPQFRQQLIEHFQPVIGEFCKDCQERLERNPLRIMDCKVDAGHPTMATAPSILDHLCEECDEHFSKVQQYLKELGIPFTLNPRLVRGLDYYTRTAFEIIESRIGAVSTLCGGGRYNGLIEQLGGPAEAPGIGFAVGLERAILALDVQKVQLPMTPRFDLYVVTLDDASHVEGARLLQQLRMAGYAADMDYMGRKMKGQIKAADRLEIPFVLLLGEDELAKNVVVLKEMATGEQQEVALSQLETVLAEKLKKNREDE